MYCLVLKEISQEFDSFLAMTFQEAFKLTTGYSYFLKVILAKRDKDLWGRRCKHCIHGTTSLHSPHSATHPHPTPPAIWYMIYTWRKSRPTAEIFQDFPYNWHVYKPQKFPVSKKVRVFTCLIPSQGMFLQAELFPYDYHDSIGENISDLNSQQLSSL